MVDAFPCNSRCHYFGPNRVKIAWNIHWKVLSNFLRVSIVCLEMSSDSDNYSGFLANEISALRYTIKSLCSRHFEKFWLSPEVRNIETENLTQTNELINISIYFSNAMRIFYVCLEMPSDWVTKVNRDVHPFIRLRGVFCFNMSYFQAEPRFL